MRTIRVWFSKTGDAAYISHLDLQRVMHRALAKAGIPAWYSLGFNPHIYMTFPLPLPLGQESVCEAMDFRTEQEELEADTVQYGLNAALPQGIRVFDVTAPVQEAKEIGFARYLVRIPCKTPQEEQALCQALEAYNAGETAVITKIGKKNGRKTEKQMDLKPYVPQLSYEKWQKGICLDLTLPAGSTVNVNPASILQFVEQAFGVCLAQAKICRTQILTSEKAKFC